MIVNKKDCLTGFYVPNAFTPNNDGLNDLFRPIIGGNIIRYQFSVYNRWGQIVFRTEKIQAGWNGSFLGKQQDGNVFIWTCTYQLDGGAVKNEKGTVVLVR
jgi:gliding motility-associated-like protein